MRVTKNKDNLICLCAFLPKKLLKKLKALPTPRSSMGYRKTRKLTDGERAVYQRAVELLNKITCDLCWYDNQIYGCTLEDECRNTQYMVNEIQGRCHICDFRRFALIPHFPVRSTISIPHNELGLLTIPSLRIYRPEDVVRDNEHIRTGDLCL